MALSHFTGSPSIAHSSGNRRLQPTVPAGYRRLLTGTGMEGDTQ